MTPMLEKKAGIAYVTINRPEVRNALNSVTMRELRDVFQEIKADDEAEYVLRVA